MKIQGTLCYVDLEGGFWTLRGDDDCVYNLGRLTDATTTTRLQDGRRVEVEGTTEDGFGIFMHGKPFTATAVRDVI